MTLVSASRLSFHSNSLLYCEEEPVSTIKPISELSPQLSKAEVNSTLTALPSVLQDLVLVEGQKAEGDRKKKVGKEQAIMEVFLMTEEEGKRSNTTREMEEGGGGPGALS